jgi:hypothetical protein
MAVQGGEVMADISAKEFREAAQREAYLAERSGESSIHGDNWSLFRAAAEHCEQLTLLREQLDAPCRRLFCEQTVRAYGFAANERDRLQRVLAEAQAQLATAKREAVEAFYGAVIHRFYNEAANDSEIITWHDALDAELARIREDR